ncbi:MAG: hypothetical protein U9R42_01250, partial [Bacteroidota bacterium]|nr:hypothetical protein [Bacteroidota bacterium]
MYKKIITHIIKCIFFLFPIISYAQPANNDYANAIDVSSIINSCSADATYTTTNGTGDKNKGSNWNTAANGNYNVWFKFTASSSQINITVDIGGTKGTQLRSQIAIWESNGTTEVTSKRYVNTNDDLV